MTQTEIAQHQQAAEAHRAAAISHDLAASTRGNNERDAAQDASDDATEMTAHALNESETLSEEEKDNHPLVTMAHQAADIGRTVRTTTPYPIYEDTLWMCAQCRKDSGNGNRIAVRYSNSGGWSPKWEGRLCSHLTVADILGHLRITK